MATLLSGIPAVLYKCAAISNDGQHIVICPTQGSPQISHNGGSTWIELTEPSTYWIDADISDNGQVLVLTPTTDTPRMSTDGGVTFDWLPGPWAQYKTCRISADGSTIVWMDNADLVYTSRDSGVTYTTYNWQSSPNRTPGMELNGLNNKVAISPDGTKIFGKMYYNGHISSSADAGVTWIDIPFTYPNKFASPEINNSGAFCIVYTNDGLVQSSPDFGSTELSNTHNTVNHGSGVSSLGVPWMGNIWADVLNLSNNTGTSWISLTSLGAIAWGSTPRIKFSRNANKLLAWTTAGAVRLIDVDTEFVANGGTLITPPPTTPPPELEITALSANKLEGNTGTTAFTFTVTRSGDLSGASSANYTVSGIGAYPADAVDFGGSFPSGTVSFIATESNKTITINVTGDTAYELNKTFQVTLSSPVDATITTPIAIGTIQDDDYIPSAGPLTNGSFENDVAGWDFPVVAATANRSIVSSSVSDQNPPSGGNVPPFYWYAEHGTYFLKIYTGASPGDTWVTVTQTFLIDEASKVVGKAAFDWNSSYYTTGGVIGKDGARVRIYKGPNVSGEIIDTPYHQNGDTIDPLTGLPIEDYWNGPWTHWESIELIPGIYTIELGAVNTGDNRFACCGLFDGIEVIPVVPPLPNNKIALKKFSLSPNVQNKTKLDDLIETVNAGNNVTFRTITNPIIVTGEDCLIPFEVLPATFVVGISDTVGTISSGDQTTYIGGTGKKIYVGSLYESLYEPSILYRKDRGGAEYSTPLDSIRINKITAIVENSHQMGMRKSGTGITTSIEYNTSEDSLGKEWDFYFKDDLRNAKMEFITSSHLDLQITQFIWQGQYHQIANRLGGR